MNVGVVDDTLAELGRGDEVAVAERVKSSANVLVSVLSDLPGDDAPLTLDRVAELLVVTSDECARFLAIAFPIVEYSEGVALGQLSRGLAYITRVTAAARTDQTSRLIAAVPAVGRIVWALAAFALHCDRPKSLVALSEARVNLPFGVETCPVMALTSLRYPDALGGSAANSFQNYHAWLARLGLLDRYPFFRRDLEAAFLEGDLVLAMYAGQLRRSTVYASGRERATVGRFLARVAAPAQRAALEALFPGDGPLEEQLELAYAAVEGDRRSFEYGPERLFPTAS